MNNREVGNQVTPPVGQTFTLYQESRRLTDTEPATPGSAASSGRKALTVPAIDLSILVGTGIVVTWILWDLSHLSSAASIRLGVPVTGLILAMLTWLGNYSQSHALRWSHAVANVARSVGLGVAVFALAGFVFAIGDGARRWLLIVSAVWFLGLSFHHGLRSRLRPTRSRVIVAGGGAVEAVAMRTALRQDRRRHHDVVGFVVDHVDDDTPDLVKNMALGSLDDLPHLVDRYRADQVVFCLDGLSGGKFARLSRTIGLKGVDVALTGLGDIASRRIGKSHVRGRPVITIAAPVRTGWQLAAKRVVDVAVSGLLLVVLSPLAAMVALTIRLVDGHAPIFAQPRVGRGGELFTIYKFRSMATDHDDVEIDLRNDHSGPVFKMTGDPRVTTVGNFLRKTSIDELPQLWNVLMGNMSMVGPRPLIQSEVEAAPPEFRYREMVTPGMTGQWQVSGRSDTDFDQLDELDRWYVDNWSLSQDLEILARTVPAVLMQRGAR